MLTAYPASGHAETSPAASKVSWLDLLNPTNEERASVESRYGLKLPSREDLSEVESSSRVSEENGVLFLSMPIVSHASALDQPPSPVGFVLSKDLLVTIRYTQLRSFDAVAAKFSKSDGPGTSVETFAALVDEMVDLSADLLEKIGAELDAVSRAVFPKLRKKRHHVSRSNDALRDVLIDVGSAGERLSRIRDILLGLQRIVPFVSGIERDCRIDRT
jgi:magnesium transporter